MRNFTLRLALIPALSVALLLLAGGDCPGPGGGEEICGDNEDNDNDGAIDEGEDADGDGYLTCDIATLIDCNDENAEIHPEQADACDGLDTNCDEEIDNVDADGDGWIDAGCGGPDCDDDNENANPDVNESCDQADNNCDGQIDEGFDADDDGFSFCDGDCADGDEGIHPGAEEKCDALDNDCDGDVDEDFDADGDGFIDRSNPACSDLYGIGAPNAAHGDCDDTNEFHRPGAQEDPTDSIDNDCDGCTDECEDFDGDGYDNCDADDAGDENCAHDGGNDGLHADCLDVDPSYYPFEPIYSVLTIFVNPGQQFTIPCEMGAVQWPEQCDSVDNNCDGQIDEGFELPDCNPTSAICPE
jgi:hypothetical protein